ncbi:hypothetical protein R1sor_001225 [Riccia sorocarpa]|uniref:Uncharacterized protein n=1 Tax=Riccia sorocarpa TaxID=122646 RepID=A0ABD3GVN6_9MARC
MASSSEIGKLEFERLSIHEENYEAFEALVIITKHLSPALYKRFRLANNPFVVWKDLKDSYGNIEKLLQPAAIEASNQLGFLDFKMAQEFDIALQDCVADLEACGLEVICTNTFKIDKTLNTFPDEKSMYAANLRL